MDLDSELNILEGLVAKHPEGIGRPALEQAYAAASGHVISWRTLLRRLDRLIAQGRVQAEGEARGTVYLPGRARVAPSLSLTAASEPARDDMGNAGYPPLSRSGSRVRVLVARPPIERPPVGYDGAFLEAYTPGKTWYLSKALRTRLHEIGRTADAAQPAGTYAREIFARLLIDLAWASSRLEGNTYTRLDTQNLIEFGQRAEGKDATEAQMILNHKAAIELLVEHADAVRFNRYTMLNLHAALSENLLGDPSDEGRLRTRIVNITGATYTPLAIPQKIEEYFNLLLTKADAITDPFEQAFFVMVQLPYLQPFADVNKRTSRLAANIPLITANLCPLSFVDIPQQAYVDAVLGVYELRRVDLLRDVFLWAYERSAAQYRVVREAMGEPDPLRLRYRPELADVVRETVRAGAAPRVESLRAWAENHGVAGGDRDAFAETALSLLLGLHEGSIARYRIRPSEFTVWKSRFDASGRTAGPA